MLGKGYKSALYLWGKNQSGYKTLFENIALQLFSLPLNCIFLFLQLEVIILDLGPENSFVKKRKDKSFFNRNTCVQQEKISTVGVALGAVFVKKTRSNYPIPLFGRTGILSRNSKIALIITPKLLTCCKKRFFLHPRRNILAKRETKNERGARSTITDGKACSLRCCVTFHLHVRFQVLERLPSIIEI